MESVKHYLLECPKYREEHHTLQRKLRRNGSSITFLLSNPIAVKPLLKYIHATGRFKNYFKSKDKDKLLTNAQNIANFRADAQAFKAYICQLR